MFVILILVQISFLILKNYKSIIACLILYQLVNENKMIFFIVFQFWISSSILNYLYGDLCNFSLSRDSDLLCIIFSRQKQPSV